MPCYQVNLMTVEFKLKNIDLIMKTLKDLRFNPQQINSRISFGNSAYYIDLEKQKITCPVSVINRIKMKYSENAIEMIAKKKKWILKKKSKNHMEVRRY